MRSTRRGKSSRIEAHEYRYTVFFEPIAEGGYKVVVPAVPEI
jgi:hypothetical protein